jgi:uncharacterized delta-60 repeat protein
MVQGPDGSMWFMEVNANKLGRIAPDGQLTEVPLPAAWGTSAGDNASLAFAPNGNPAADGNLWLGTHQHIAEINAHDGHLGEVIHDYVIPSTSGSPYDWSGLVIALDSHGYVWYTEPYVNDLIGRVIPGTDITTCDIAEFPVPGNAFGKWGALGIVYGPDGNLWFEATNSPLFTGIGYLGHIDPRQLDKASLGESLVNVPIEDNNGVPITDNVRGLTSGPDGCLWMTGADRILRVNTQGQVTGQFPTTSNSGAYGMTIGPDNALWFAEPNANNIGRIAATAATGTHPDEFPITTGGQISLITTGPDENLWFAEANTNKIARYGLAPNHPPVASFVARDSSGNVVAAVNEGQSIHFDASGSTDPDLFDGANLTHDWQINGTPVASTAGQVLDWRFLDSGTYSVTLTVEDPWGAASASYTQTITVSDQAPAAQFFAYDSAGNVITTVNEGDTVRFKAVNGGPPVLTYDWQIDGVPVAAGQELDWTAPHSGSHAVTLSVEFGGVVSAPVTLTVPVHKFPPVVEANLVSAGGTLDPSFGTGGVATIDVSAATGDRTGDVVFDPAPLGDGRIVAPFKDNGVVVGFRRFLANGSPDTTFGPNGRALLTLPAADGTYAAYALDGDQIVVATQCGHQVWLTQLKADGSIDPTFGTQSAASDIGGPVRMTVLPSHQLFLVGGTDAGMAVVRGLLDPNFGSDKAEVPTTTASNSVFGGLYNSPAAILVQSPDKILVGDSGFAVYRFNTDGTLDTSFGHDVFTNQSSGWNDQVLLFDVNLVGSDPLSALALDPQNGGIIAEGNYGIVRYTSDGQLDSRFGPLHDGVLAYPGVAVSFNQTISIAGQNHQVDLGLGLGAGSGFLSPAGVAIQSDGTIILGGPYQNAVRLHDDGTKDTGFGQSGLMRPQAGGVSTGMVLMTGSSATLVGNDTNGNITLVRFFTAPASTSVVVGQTFTLAARATDHDAVDQAAGFTYQIDWGDGSPAEPPFTGDGAGITRTHHFASVAVAPPDTIDVKVTDKDGALTDSQLTVTVEPVTYDGLQAVFNNGLPIDPVTKLPAVILPASTSTDADAVVDAVNHLSAQSTPVAVVLNLGAGSFTDLTPNPPAGVTLVINGNGTTTTIVGQSPALTVGSGNVVVTGVTFTTATDAPTILVTGGSLTLRNDVIQESTGYNQAAIQVTGGTVDLGTAADPGGNTININGTGTFVRNATAFAVPTVGDAFAVNGVPVVPSSLSGLVWEDFNDDGQVDFGENGIRGVTVTLTGTDYLGDPENVSQTTDGDGAYVFLLLLPGNYQITETQPAGYLQGIDAVGTAGGTLAATDQFAVPLEAGVNGLNYNFGEQPAATGPVRRGQAAGIGFWNNRNGQALIKALPVVTNADGSVTSVANWLAATLPHMFGIYAGSNNLTGQSNAYVAALFQQDFVLHGVKLDAQVLATALSVYATNATLDATKVAAQYGFTVSGDGVGTAGVNVGSDSDAFGVANNTTMTVMDLLLATDAQSVNGVLYNGNATKRSHANDVYIAVNQAGGL